MSKSVAIVLSGGKGSRMNSDIPKQYMEVCGHPILFYSLRTFEESEIDEIVLVTAPGDEEFCRREIVEKYNLTKVGRIVAGGSERFNSVYNGLLAIEEADYVLIHDGARPFVTGDIISRNLEALKSDRAVVTGMPSKDTVKISDDEGYVSFTPNRANVWNVQTPQSFDFHLVKDAYTKLLESKNTSVTDDAQAVELFGNCRVRFVEGSYTNIKITTPDDLIVAEKILG
ncbi:MAG: 2-C-methyl-D-erythritol 4-phosphate cytidylyltransferase [Lachnospiraceae bacterium]|nr:2-C-methyl-D-erythritol 4-phosphate cytidylyltransferase [Lachnospiraceae bacterium]